MPVWAVVGLSVLAIIAVLVIVFVNVAGWYKKIPPNQVAVITGRKHKFEENGVKGERGYRFVSGGGALVIPIVEEMKTMSLNMISVPVQVKDAPSKDGVKVTVTGIANLKIAGDRSSLPLAIERFLGVGDSQIKEIISQTLDANLRAIVGTMTVEELVRDRTAFTQNVLTEAGTDLGKMGLAVDTVKIKEISDEHGYIDALGKARTAQVVRDALVGEAEANRETAIKTAAARQAGETATAQAEQAISDANRARDMQIADNEAKVVAQQAQIPIAGKIAEATRTQELNVAEVNAEKARVTAEIELQGVVAQRNEAELQATVVVKAEKEREATVITADAGRQAAELNGEATRLRMEKEGLGAQAKATGEAEGRMKTAAAVQRELEAKAAGEKAGLLAVAAGKQADLEATAAGETALAGATKARLLAEAEGILKKAEAYKQLDEAGRFLMILQALPPVIEAAGFALERSIKPLAEAIGEGLGNVDEIRLIDFGGANGGGEGEGKSILNRFASQPAQTIYGLWQQIKAVGLGPLVEGLAKKAGINLDNVVEGTATEAPSAAS